MYDLQIYNIVKYVQLCMECNPNMIDSLFTPEVCVLHVTRVGQILRDNRKLFLHQGICDRFKGYAYAQIHKMQTKDPEPGSNRERLREKFGFDMKFAYHTVRLLNEAEQLLLEGDLDLQRNREQLKSIRRGEWTEAQISTTSRRSASTRDRPHARAASRPAPDEAAIRDLLLRCLEAHYGIARRLHPRPRPGRAVAPRDPRQDRAGGVLTGGGSASCRLPVRSRLSHSRTARRIRWRCSGSPREGLDKEGAAREDNTN